MRDLRAVGRRSRVRAYKASVLFMLVSPGRLRSPRSAGLPSSINGRSAKILRITTGRSQLNEIPTIAICLKEDGRDERGRLQ